MENKNDNKILELKAQIAKKKEELSKKKNRFVPITNCSIDFDGARLNIQTLTKEQLQMMLIRLHMYIKSAQELNMVDVCNFSGYNVCDWVEDIKSKLNVLSFKDEENKLKMMEAKLEKMLSDEKKTELELAEIENMLK
jgi:endonuclease V-like protein UPF0215 family